MTPDPAATIPAAPTATNSRQSAAWDIANAPRNYISLVATQGGSAAFSFASVWLLTQYLGSEGYGGIVAVIAASQIAQVLVNWTSIAVVRFGVEEFIESARIARTFWVRLAALALNLLVVAVSSVWWFPPLAAWLRLSTETYWLVLAHFVVTALWIHIQMSLQGVKMLRLQGVLMMTERFIIVAAIVSLLGAAQLTNNAAILCYTLAPAVTIVVGILAVRRHIFSRFSFDAAFVRKLMAFSLPLLPFSLVGFFSGSYVDAVFVSNYLSTSDLGVYSVATQINGVVLQLPTLANTLLLPLLVTTQREAKTERTSNYFSNVLPSLTLGWGLACTALAYLGSLIIPHVFGAEYQFATLPLWILLTSTAIFLPVMIGYAALSNATSTTYISMIAAILAAVANVAANFVLIPRYGTVGCALATLIAFATSLVTFLVLLKREFETPYSWTLAAIVPVLTGAFIALTWQTPAFAAMGCIAISFLIGGWFRNSLAQTYVFIRNMRA